MKLRSMISVACLASVLPASGHLFNRRLHEGDAPLEIKYLCVTETWVGNRLISKDRILYDHGKFRSERLDPKTGKPIGLIVYNRDGQGLSFLYSDLSPPVTGVDLQGVLYRLSRDDPKQFARFAPGEAATTGHAHEPGPVGGLNRFRRTDFPPGRNGLRQTGSEIVAGKPCTIYQIGDSTLKVWNGYVMETASHSGTRRFARRVTHLILKPKVAPRDFELIPGSIVKVPQDLHVRLPKNVTRIEYPGRGISTGTVSESKVR